MNPVGERIFVKVDETDVRSAGGLVLPSSAQKEVTQGLVTVVSEGCTLKVAAAEFWAQFWFLGRRSSRVWSIHGDRFDGRG